jgi:hypothetical protein
MPALLTLDEIRSLYESSNLNVPAIAAAAGCSRAAVYNYIKDNKWERSIPIRNGRPVIHKIAPSVILPVPVISVCVVVPFPSVHTGTLDAMMGLLGRSISCPSQIQSSLSKHDQSFSLETFRCYSVTDCSAIEHVVKDYSTLPHVLFFRCILTYIRSVVDADSFSIDYLYICICIRVEDTVQRLFYRLHIDGTARYCCAKRLSADSL